MAQTQGTAQLQIKSWDEKPYTEIDQARKLTKATVTYGVSGGIEGEIASESLMCYAADGSAVYVGLERVVGRVGDRSGSFVLQGSGSYDGTTARSTASVVPGSGTDGLVGVSGTTSLVATHENATVTFDLDLG
jgi:hypothetical protein